jgi:hypothetical protein
MRLDKFHMDTGEVAKVSVALSIDECREIVRQVPRNPLGKQPRACRALLELLSCTFRSAGIGPAKP